MIGRISVTLHRSNTANCSKICASMIARLMATIHLDPSLDQEICEGGYQHQSDGGRNHLESVTFTFSTAPVTPWALFTR